MKTESSNLINPKGAVVGTLAFLSSILIGVGLVTPSREVDYDIVRLKDNKLSIITKRLDGSLGGRLGTGINPTVNVIDKNADGIADYIRAGYFAARNGAEFRYEVPERIQKLYQETYQRSKFYKDKIENGK